MRKFSGIGLCVTVLSVALFLENGSCKNARTPENAQASTATAMPAMAEIEDPIEASPDPENTVRFTLVYTSNLKAEYEECG